MESERLLVTVRTYPAISAKYIELVCTGGITEGGQWLRLYPVPHRYLEEQSQYKTYDVISVDVGPGKDGRLETRTPANPTIRVIRHVKGWRERREWVEPTTFESLAALVDAGRSIGPVRASKVLEFSANPTSPDWTPAQLAKLQQGNLLEEAKPLEKIPFDFRFRWRDGDGKEHDSHVLAWEFGETWRQYRHRYSDPIAQMRDKWMDDLCGPKRDVYFYLGNQARFQHVFSICGIFGPPKEHESSGKLW